MIAFLRGFVHSRHDDTVVIMVKGVGYQVTCTRAALQNMAQVAGEVDVPVITNVTDHSIDLYGFADHTEKQLYTKLVSVSGIGPKAAIVLLGTFGARTLVKHIYAGEEKAITKAPGIGKKSAKRLIVDLAGAMDEFRTSFSRPIETVTGVMKKSALVEQASAALVNLGFRSAEVNAIAQELEAKVAAGADISALVKHGLALLRKER